METPEIPLTHEILRLISSIDEFKGEWRAIGNLPSETLQSLRRVATIESVGSSTRIEGAQLTDAEVERFLGSLRTESFRSRDEEEVAGYALVMNTVHTSWEDMPLTQGILLQLHRDLLRYSNKDERHRGAWKVAPNHVAAFDANGREVGIVFETASPFDTPFQMEQLLRWHSREQVSSTLHPLLCIAVFVVKFLAIHPFQDGNGRLSRIVTTLLLLRAGYGYVPYSSLESIVEHRKKGYYLALRRTQTSLRSEQPDWEPWLMFFLRALRMQIDSLRERLTPVVDSPRVRETAYSVISMPSTLSPLAESLLSLLRSRGTLQVAAAAAALQANRNTLKLKFSELIEAGEATLYGKGRGAHYRPTRR